MGRGMVQARRQNRVRLRVHGRNQGPRGEERHMVGNLVGVGESTFHPEEVVEEQVVPTVFAQ